MDPFKQREALRAEAKALRDTLARQGRKMTPREVDRVKAISTELADLDTKCAPIENATAALKSVVDLGGTRSQKAQSAQRGSGIGAKFAEAAAAHVAATKSLLPTGGVSVTIDDGIVPVDRRASTLLGAIHVELLVGEANTKTYLRQTVRTNNAATVAQGAQKPTSLYELKQETAKAATVAHLSGPHPRQWFSDVPTLSEFLAAEMGLGLEQAIEAFVLNGGTAEDGTPVVGILNDTAVAPIAFTTDAMLSVRRALGDLDDKGIVPSAIVLNGTDWEAIETAKDDEGRFVIGGSPTNGATRSLWKVPVVVSPSLPAGKALVGDLRTAVSLLYRETAETRWTEGDGALFDTNTLKFRSEARVLLEVSRPTALRLVDLAAA